MLLFCTHSFILHTLQKKIVKSELQPSQIIFSGFIPILFANFCFNLSSLFFYAIKYGQTPQYTPQGANNFELSIYWSPEYILILFII